MREQELTSNRQRSSGYLDYGRDEASYDAAPQAALLIAAMVLSLASILLVAIGASEEPYFGEIKIHQGLLQVGGSAILAFCWLPWMGAVGLLIRRKRLHPVWAAAIVWVIIVEFYLVSGAIDYMQDIQKYQRVGNPNILAPLKTPSSTQAS